MRREFREASESQALPTVARPAEAEALAQTPPRIRPEVAPLSVGVIAVAVADLCVGLVAALYLMPLFQPQRIPPTAWFLGLQLLFGGIGLMAVGTLGAAVCLIRRRYLAARVLQFLAASAAMFGSAAFLYVWRGGYLAPGGHVAKVLLVAMPTLLLVSLSAYLGARLSGAGDDDASRRD